MLTEDAGDAPTLQRCCSLNPTWSTGSLKSLLLCEGKEGVPKSASFPFSGSHFFQPEAEDLDPPCSCLMRPGCDVKRERLLPHAEKETRERKVTVSCSPVCSLICRLQSKLCIKSPWGAEPTCSPFLFVQT